MARETLSTLITSIINNLPDNTSGAITAQILRDLLQQITNNVYLPYNDPTYGEINITSNPSNTVSIGAGQTTTDDTMLPITYGTTYFKIPGFSAGTVAGGVTYDMTVGGITAPLAGSYTLTGWATVRHSGIAATVAIVFGIFRGGSLIGVSPRPTPSKMPNGGDVGLISGGGLLDDLQPGDVLVPLIGSDTTGTITVENATLILQLVAASGL